MHKDMILIVVNVDIGVHVHFIAVVNRTVPFTLVLIETHESIAAVTI